MKICIFSDIHGNQYAFEKFVSDVEEKYDFYIFLGDIYGYMYGIEEILKLFKRLQPLYAIKGNHDVNYQKICNKEVDKNRYIEKYGDSYNIISEELTKFLMDKNTMEKINIDNLNIALVHGTLEDSVNGRDYPDSINKYPNSYHEYDVVFQGHTHYKMVKFVKNGPIIVNPGSIGLSRNEDGCTYAVFDTLARSINFKKIIWNKDKLFHEIKEHNTNLTIIDVLEREK